MNTPIDIMVKTQYLEDQSMPDDSRYVFTYTITLTNQSPESAQLVSRHWVITDSNEAVQEVKGLGVVGQQPVLEPGESYTYSSGVVLSTETGTMMGSYQMRTATGTTFEAPIPEFALVPPFLLH
jgi:ApaG protein